jgi:hypothetical protein
MATALSSLQTGHIGMAACQFLLELIHNQSDVEVVISFSARLQGLPAASNHQP